MSVEIKEYVPLMMLSLIFQVLIFGGCFSVVCQAATLTTPSTDSEVLFDYIDNNRDDILTIPEAALFLKDFVGHEEANDGVFGKSIVFQSEEMLKMQELEEGARLINLMKCENTGRIDETMLSITKEEFLAGFPIPPAPLDPEWPQQVHVSLTGDPTSVNIMWVTKAAVNSSHVRWGSSSNGTNLNMTTKAIRYTYEAGIGGWVGWIYHATLTGLADDCYSYMVGTDDKMSNVSTYCPTGPNVAMTGPRRMAIYGDQGTVMPMGAAVQAQMTADHASNPLVLVAVAGDQSYAGIDGGKNGKSKKEVEFIWDLYGRMISPLASVVPFHVTLGNHDSYYNFSAVQARFIMPRANGGNTNYYYSYDIGGVHFVHFCTETYALNHTMGYTSQTPQYQWLEADLAAASQNRVNVPFIVVLGHRPMYNDYSNRTDTQEALESLFNKYDVDIGVWGHVHCYYRTFPMNAAKVTNYNTTHYINPIGTIHTIVGSGGALIGEICHPLHTKQPYLVHKALDRYGYGRLTVHNATTIQFEFLEWESNSVADEFYIVKE